MDTELIGQVRYSFNQLPSTNDFAVQLLKTQSVTEGTLITTSYQTHGKGQTGNQWLSEPSQNIAMSILLKPGFLLPTQQFYLNIIAALAVRTAIVQFADLPIMIKWANDIVVHRRKLCGILIQNTLSGEKIKDSIIGIGMNVNQTTFEANLPKAISLAVATNQSFNIDQIIEAICQQLERFYLMLKAQQLDLLRQKYFEHLYQFEEWAWYQRPTGETFKGKITGISPTGALVIAHEERIEKFGLKEIVFL